MRYPIANSVVLITGATGGIGTATANALHARGAKVVLTGRRRDVLDALVRQLGGDRTLAMPSDVGRARAPESGREALACA